MTGGDTRVEVPADKINQGFVLGNKVMVGTVNANREYFELGVRDMAQAEAAHPGWLGRLLTHPVKGLDNYRQLMDTLTTAKGAMVSRSPSRTFSLPAAGSTLKKSDPASDIASNASPAIDSAWVTASRANGLVRSTDRRGVRPVGRPVGDEGATRVGSVTSPCYEASSDQPPARAYL